MHIYIITNEDNIGDNNNALGIALSIQRSASHCVTTTQTTLKQLDYTLDPDAHNIIIAAGEHHFNSLSTFAQQDLGNSTYTIWSAHQVPHDIASCLNTIDIIVLPEHVVNDDIKNIFLHSTTKVVTYPGVLHTLNQQKLTTAYEQWQTQLPDLDGKKSYLSVVLAGDAPYNDGGNTTIRRFDEANAYYFGQYVATRAQAHQQHILITNGPRTGKHDAYHNPIANNHQDPSHIDPVTLAFCEGLAANGISKNSYTLFNFIFNQPSAYHALLEAAHISNGNILLPGESTSMATECNEVLDHRLLCIYQNPAMNPIHDAFITELCKYKTIERISLNGRPIANTSNNSSQKTTATEPIGKIVLEHCIENTPSPGSPYTKFV